ncbi:MAG: protein translocase subunit SecD [Syntrophomonadaceae bacterium]|nr:protein translocase subunit SecD [Syntrophomonadaceae bacterium]
MRRGSTFHVVLFFATILVVLAGAAMSVTPIKQHINLGLDLQGGIHVVLQAVDTPETPVTAEGVKSAVGVIRNRVDQLGLKEPIIQPEGTDRIIVELAGVQDPEEAVALIGKTAILEFKNPEGQTVLLGNQLKDAQAGLNQAGQPEIHLTFNAEGAEAFGKITSANVGRQIAIYLDGVLLTNPVVEEPITTGDAVIRGGYKSLQEAEQHAILLRSGALPVKLEMIEKRAVGPTLGEESLQKSYKAGLIGIILIFLFMIGYYRFPGVIAGFSLVLYGALVMGILAALNATLTLPGIAGFILSIGMAVDANIIIYERLKEELRAGKTLMAAIDSGFTRAFWTIFDANLTTLIGAGVLLYFGSGPIKGFAVTLSIGILCSMFTAITFTRFMLRTVARSQMVTNLKLYGA